MNGGRQLKTYAILYSSGYMQRWLINLFCSTFKQRISIRMRNCTHGSHRMVKETNETINFQACFFFNLFYYCMKPSKLKVNQCALFSMCTVCYIIPVIIIKNLFYVYYPFDFNKAHFCHNPPRQHSCQEVIVC